jgi:hypothetical protein
MYRCRHRSRLRHNPALKLSDEIYQIAREAAERIVQEGMTTFIVHFDGKKVYVDARDNIRDAIIFEEICLSLPPLLFQGATFME